MLGVQFLMRKEINGDCWLVSFAKKVKKNEKSAMMNANFSDAAFKLCLPLSA